MPIFQTIKPFVKLYETADSETPAKSLGAGIARFVGENTETNGRLHLTREGQTDPKWWVDATSVEAIDAVPSGFELSPIEDFAFHEDADFASRLTSDHLDAGGMNAEYLLLLAWAESGWTNTDAEGRDGEDTDLDSPIGPFRFSVKRWDSLLNDSDYEEIFRGYTSFDRIKPQAQCLFAAVNTNRLQRVLKDVLNIDPPAWLLRVGYRIGETAIVRFAKLNDNDSVATEIDGVASISRPVVNANPKLFPNKSDTKKSEVLAAVVAEFETAKKAVIKRLGDLIQESVIDGMIDASSPSLRKGALGFLDFIAKYESNGNYNAVVDRVKNQNNPKLTAMTIEQVLEFQEKLGKRDACGKYQIIESTLNGNFAAAGLSKGDLYDSENQDKLGYQLLMVVRKGEAFLNSQHGQAEIAAFALAVAQEWAAMPVLDAMTGHNSVQLSRGDSYYKGTAGNAAGVSADTFEGAIQKFIDEA